MDSVDRDKIKDQERNDVITEGGVTLFWGGWASQWYPSFFRLDGLEFNCAEQFMMWSKAKLFGDALSMDKIMKAKWPKAQKQLGREAGPWNPAWDEPMGSRLVVLRGCMAKFQQNPDLWRQLAATGDSIIGEASPYDKIWGIGMGKDDSQARNPERWTGKNYLGQALMLARTLIKDYERGCP